MGVGNFYFWEGLRQRHIEEHSFYVSQAKARILCQFADIENEADKYSNNWLERVGQNFCGETQDPNDYIEAAYEISIEHYMALASLKKSAYLSVLASMFHQFEKSLRKWLVREIAYFINSGENSKQAIWMKDFPQIIDLLDGLGFDVKDRKETQDLKICHLIVNVYKHGNGKSFELLKEIEPAFVLGKFQSKELMEFKHIFANYEALEIDEDDINRFSNDIIEFWIGIPEFVYFDQIKKIPNWLEKAIEKDEGPSDGFNAIR